MTLSLHSQLEAILTFPQDPMTSAEAAEVLGGFNASSLQGAARAGLIEATKVNFRGHGKRDRLRFTKAALLRLPWTRQDSQRETLRTAIDALCPHMWRVLEPHAHAAKSKRPANVLSFEHPDLFADTAAQQQSA